MRNLLGLVLIFFLTACGNLDINEVATQTSAQVSEVPVDISWMTGDPCFPPCWHGLIVDDSTEKEVLTVLEILEFVDFGNIESSTIGFGDALTGEHYNATLISIPTHGKSSIQFTVGNERLKKIGFGINYELSMSEVVDQIGSPDFVRTWADFDNNFCDVEVYWQEKQLVAYLRFQDSNWLEICESIEKGGQISRATAVPYIEIIYQNWIAAIIERNEVVSWAGLSD